MTISYTDIATALRPLAKKSVRVSDDAFNDEIDANINAALADMRRVGIAESSFDAASPYYPLVKQAVILYCKALFGKDNPNAEMSFFQESYHQTVVDLLNSGANGADSDGLE